MNVHLDEGGIPKEPKAASIPHRVHLMEAIIANTPDDILSSDASHSGLSYEHYSRQVSGFQDFSAVERSRLNIWSSWLELNKSLFIGGSIGAGLVWIIAGANNKACVPTPGARLTRDWVGSICDVTKNPLSGMTIGVLKCLANRILCLSSIFSFWFRFLCIISLWFACSGRGCLGILRGSSWVPGARLKPDGCADFGGGDEIFWEIGVSLIGESVGVRDEDVVILSSLGVALGPPFALKSDFFLPSLLAVISGVLPDFRRETTCHSSSSTDICDGNGGEVLFPLQAVCAWFSRTQILACLAIDMLCVLPSIPMNFPIEFPIRNRIFGANSSIGSPSSLIQTGVEEKFCTAVELNPCFQKSIARRWPFMIVGPWRSALHRCVTLEFCGSDRKDPKRRFPILPWSMATSGGVLFDTKSAATNFAPSRYLLLLLLPRLQCHPTFHSPSSLEESLEIALYRSTFPSSPLPLTFLLKLGRLPLPFSCCFLALCSDAPPPP
ncbi:uncharacterized protein G2W53_018849 [Senna tora]|uniref:Uncharacterized protein n=1 Tax=Senna tora TaxID=362788 RepID=A0A834TSK3_9FABA|nr:uncharacterized protein G2W53_018849 [Senna tora]